RICQVGKPALAYAKAGADEYLKRLRRYATVDVAVAKDGQQLLKLSENTVRIALDERGDRISTSDWVKRINAWELDGVKAASLLIGGANGHSEELRDSCDEVWSLSGLTLQHELALVVLLEGLYRCYTIKRGEPYHR
ncbi:MAG: 23S rRNA (pseudouridine1915-N3)-methyltransferase, partial [Verrucomicrobiales bacterium]